MRALQNCKIIRAKIIPLHPLRGCTWRGYLEIFGCRVPLGLGNLCLADKSNANFFPFFFLLAFNKTRVGSLGLDRIPDWIGLRIGSDCYFHFWCRRILMRTDLFKLATQVAWNEKIRVLPMGVEPVHMHLYNGQLPHATTSCKQPPPVSDHFQSNSFVSQSNTFSKTLL